jgi:hypothetical protein
MLNRVFIIATSKRQIETSDAERVLFSFIRLAVSCFLLINDWHVSSFFSFFRLIKIESTCLIKCKHGTFLIDGKLRSLSSMLTRIEDAFRHGFRFNSQS